MPNAALGNVTLLLGNNGKGKSTILKGIAMALTSPVLRYAGFHAYSLVRKGFTPKPGKPVQFARVEAKVILGNEDSPNSSSDEHSLFLKIERKGTMDAVTDATPDEGVWSSMFNDSYPGFFVLGYGTTRWSAPREDNVAVRLKSGNLRHNRIRSLFEEGYSLIPLSQWLPSFPNKGRRTQVIRLLDELLVDYDFKGEVDESGELILEKDGARIPLPALSDGYRAFIGWIGDFLYHLCMWAAGGKKLREVEGVVLVDEIDLHLHPDWQRTIISTLSKALPCIQFIFTSHSPLVTGSMEWPNIWVMKEGGPDQLPNEPIHGLSADQVLLSPYFGVQATRTDEKMKRLADLDAKAQAGDVTAAHLYMRELSTGMEAGKYDEAAVYPQLKGFRLPDVAQSWSEIAALPPPPVDVAKKLTRKSARSRKK
jgi:energy-coupling factor transporter ATP-binding protein EcfA2